MVADTHFCADHHNARPAKQRGVDLELDGKTVGLPVVDLNRPRLKFVGQRISRCVVEKSNNNRGSPKEYGEGKCEDSAKIRHTGKYPEKTLDEKLALLNTVKPANNQDVCRSE